MRKEAVYALLLNITLFKGMSCSLAQDPRYIRFSAFENGKTTHYNLRVRTSLSSIARLTNVMCVMLLGIECEDRRRAARRDSVQLAIRLDPLAWPWPWRRHLACTLVRAARGPQQSGPARTVLLARPRKVSRRIAFCCPRFSAEPWVRLVCRLCTRIVFCGGD